MELRRQDVIRVFLFVVFFGIGASALGVSILCNDLLRYYTDKQLLKAAEVSLKQLESLNNDYDVLLQRLEKDPNLVKRIAGAALGAEREDKEVVYPKVTAEQLAAAKKVLTEAHSQQSAEPAVPGWLTRCSEPRQRIVLFLAGAVLILISFICFNSAKQFRQKQS